MPLSVGKLGHYEIIALLGKVGMARCTALHDTTLKKGRSSLHLTKAYREMLADL